MMQCQICGDLDGPWEFQVYKTKNKKPWLFENGALICVCEECSKIINKEMKEEIRKKKEHDRYYNSYEFRR